MKFCLYCQKLVEKKAHRKRSKFCNDICWIAFARKDQVVKICETCGTNIQLAKSTAEKQGKYCSPECYRRGAEPYQQTHGFSSKKNKFLRDRYTVVLNRLKKKIPDFKASDLPNDYWRALVLCEIACLKLGLGRNR